jgi:hypothetical protein
VEGLTDEEETILLDAEEFIHPIGTLAVANLCQIQPFDPSFSPSNSLIPHTEGSMSVDEIRIWEKVKTIPIAKWSQTEDDELRNLNLGSTIEPNII